MAQGQIGTDLRPTDGMIFLEGGQNDLVACVYVLTHVLVPVICLRLTSVEGLRLQYVSIYALNRRSL